MRAIDEPIPHDETLFRAIGAEHVAHGHLDPSFVDLQGTSVHRLKYCVTPHTPMLASRPELNGLADTTVARLPQPIPLGGLTFRFFAIDARSEADQHHAEIRVNTDPTSTDNRPRIKSSEARRVLRDALAAAFTVHIWPSSA